MISTLRYHVRTLYAIPSLRIRLIQILFRNSSLGRLICTQFVHGVDRFEPCLGHLVVDDFEDIEGPFDGQGIHVDHLGPLAFAGLLRHVLHTQGLADSRHSRNV